MLSAQLAALQSEKLASADAASDADGLQKQLLDATCLFAGSLTRSTAKEQLAERVKVLEAQLQAQTAQSTQLQASLDASRDGADAAAKQLEASSASLSAAKQELARCAADLAAEKANSEHFLQDIQAVKQQSAALRQQLDEAQRRQAALQSRCEAQQQQIDVATLEQKRLAAAESAAKQLAAALEAKAEAAAVAAPTASEAAKAGEEAGKELRAQLEAKNAENERLGAEVRRLQGELGEREARLAAARSEASGLRAKEAEATRSGEVVRAQEKELEALHAKLQKSEARSGEEKLKLESRATLAEQSLEAYKQEMEGALREKLSTVAELKQAREELAQLKKANEVWRGGATQRAELDARAESGERVDPLLRRIDQQAADSRGHEGRSAHRASPGGRRAQSGARQGDRREGGRRADALRRDGAAAVAAGSGHRGEEPAANRFGNAAREFGVHADAHSGGRGQDRALEGRAGEQLPAEANPEAVHASADGGGRSAPRTDDAAAQGAPGPGAGSDAQRGRGKRGEHAERGRPRISGIRQSRLGAQGIRRFARFHSSCLAISRAIPTSGTSTTKMSPRCRKKRQFR